MIVAALDIGGTTLKGGLVDGSGRVVLERRWTTPRHEGPDAVVAAVLAAARDLFDLGTSVTGLAPAAIGVASLGLIDAEAGVAVHSSTVGWADVPLVRLVRERVAAPVVLAHDIAAAAVAETDLLDVDAESNLLFVAIGTGLGGTAIVNGRPVLGAHRRAGEIGHVRVCEGMLPCGCGQVGCLETVASGPAIGAAYQALSGVSSPTTARDVAELAAAGDGLAGAVWGRATSALAEALAGYSMVLDPSTVILGGGLSLAGRQLTEPVAAALAARLPFAGVPRVVAAQLGDRAAMLGVASLAVRSLAARS